ncbi:MAG: hypothetical protein IJJ33_06365 [Victivallales bacterium]|nr:hypothetical protein [Victivallales bacterium]
MKPSTRGADLADRLMKPSTGLVVWQTALRAVTFIRFFFSNPLDFCGMHDIVFPKSDINQSDFFEEKMFRRWLNRLE